MSSREYMNRGDNFLSNIRRSVESGTTVNWSIVGQQLSELFFQTHKDGIAQGGEFAVHKRLEQEALERALTKLLDMGAAQAKKNAARHKRMAIEALREELTGCMREVVVDSLDLSGRKLDRLIDKFAKRLDLVVEELKADEAIEEEE